MKIHYFDFVAAGGIHTTFNSAMIEVLGKVYPENEGIVLHSEKRHGEIVKKKCLTEIQVKSRKAIDKIKYRKVKDFFNSIVVFFKILFKNKEDIFFIGIAFPFTVNSIFTASKLFGKKVFVCLHGELQQLLDCDEAVFDRKGRAYFSKMNYAFSRKNENVNYVILGKTIFESVKHLFHSKNKIIVINHPALFPEKQKSGRLHKPVVIAQIGQAAKRKGSHHLFEIAKLLENEIAEGQVVFEFLGMCGDEFPEKQLGLVKFSKEFLSEEELCEHIREIDFSLQLTTDSICTAIASGTLIDSLIFEKPVIGLHSTYLDSYITGRHKSLVCSSVEELASLIKTISKTCTEKEYDEYVDSVLQMKKFFSVETNADLFRKGLEK